MEVFLFLYKSKDGANEALLIRIKRIGAPQTVATGTGIKVLIKRSCPLLNKGYNLITQYKVWQ